MQLLIHVSGRWSGVECKTHMGGSSRSVRAAWVLTPDRCWGTKLGYGGQWMEDGDRAQKWTMSSRKCGST